MLIQVKQRGTIGIVLDAFMYEPLRDHGLFDIFDKQAVSRALAFDIGW